jgi:DNA-binding response OmpR family regulator
MVSHVPHVSEWPTIVVCEPDEDALESLCDHLTADHHEVLPAPTVADALRLCRYGQPDLLILELALPGASGLDILREIRQADGASSRYDAELPIIVLNSGGGEADRVRVLEEGADDFIVLPARYEELRARIGTIFRRTRRNKTLTRVGELMLDPDRWKVMVGDRDVQLTKKEFRLLRILASDPTRVFSKDELLEQEWGEKRPKQSSRTLDSHMSRMRMKLDREGGRYIVNCWGIGYRLVEA